MLTPNTIKILNRYGKQSVEKMQKQAKPFSASGNMVKGFRYEVTAEGLTIYGVNYLRWAETGRGATRAGAKKGNPTLREAIEQWLKFKGIPLWRDKRGRFIGRRTMAFVIARKIHREGTLLYRKKKTRDIFSNIITEESVSKLIKQITGNYIITTNSDLLRVFQLALQNRTAA
jgi:hypothetical protein